MTLPMLAFCFGALRQERGPAALVPTSSQLHPRDKCTTRHRQKQAVGTHEIHRRRALRTDHASAESLGKHLDRGAKDTRIHHT